jgi:hypothetical protein
MRENLPERKDITGKQRGEENVSGYQDVMTV